MAAETGGRIDFYKYWSLLPYLLEANKLTAEQGRISTAVSEAKGDPTPVFHGIIALVGENRLSLTS